MSTTTYSITSFEQGTITSSGDNQSSSTRIRTGGYIYLQASADAVYTVTATDTNGNPLRTNIMMYDSSKRCIYDSGWDESGTAIADSHNASYVRIVLSYNSGNISPSDFGECTLEYNDGRSWHITDGQITNEFFIQQPESSMTAPYPKSVWRIDSAVNSGFPYNELLRKIPEFGAFMNAVNLKEVYIPRSCTRIGEYAFTNTALKKVRISRNCTYYPTSFPPDCEIEFYEGGGVYEQLYDSGEYLIIDADGALVYGKE